MTEQTQVEEQQFTVTPEALQDLAQRLREAGYANLTAGLERTVVQAVTSFWGHPAKCQVRKDGWAIDMSGPLRGLAYFAIVQSQGGQRVITRFMEEEELLPTSGSTLVAPEPEGAPAQAPEHSTLAQALDEATGDQAQARAVHAPAVQHVGIPPQQFTPPNTPEFAQEPPPEAPALVRWLEFSEDEEGADATWRDERTTHGKVNEVMTRLLVQGVSLESVEVWTDLKKPKVEVKLT